MSERQWLTPHNEEEWLEYRKPDITSTDTAALFGLSPYKTVFELYHKHASGIELPFDETDRVKKGKALEWAVANLAAEQEQWTDLKPLKDYCRIVNDRIGSSFDCEAVDRDGKPILVEIKLVDTFRFMDGWEVDKETGDIEAPPHIEVQVQHELELADRFDQVAIVAWVGAYDCRVIYRDRDRAFGKAIRKKTAEFWQMVADKKEPAPDFLKDGDVIAAMFKSPREDFDDKTADADFEALLNKYDMASAQEKEFKKIKDAAKSEIHYKLGASGGAFTERFKVTTGMTNGSADRIAEAGEIIKGRASYRQCLVKRINGD